ncbi:hypothetical protein HAX54_023273, partial [Datura stramonium]|nr:hypothetical protein [Datura stramonium]
EAKYVLENWINEGRLALEFPAIRDKVRELGLGYIFVELEECNLTLVREFYANWETSFGEINKVKICGEMVRFTTKTFDAFLHTRAVDPFDHFFILEKPPYYDIHHTFCGIEEEELDLRLHLAGRLAGKIMDVTKVKEPSCSTAPSLSIADHQARE